MELHIPIEGMKKLGSTVKGHLDTHIKDRTGPIEEQMIKNLRQYRAKYDPQIEHNIPAERSHAYPRDTRKAVKDFVAKLMEMMFPSQEENWELRTSPVPSIPQSDLENIISALEQQEIIISGNEQREPRPVTSDQIEREVIAFAEARKDAMEKEIADQLADEDTDYPQLCKRVLRSGGIYGIGVARSPMVRKLKERVWELSEQTGRYEAKTKEINRPYPEYVRIWDIFPDLSAHTWYEQERIFERMVLGRHDFAKLGKRPDFFKSVIDQYLKDNQQGNYREATFESDLRALANNSTISNKASRRYELYRMLGFLDAHELVKAGVEVPEEQMGQDILADVWIIDDIVIKAEVAVFGERPADQYPAFIPAEDEDSGLMGIGIPEDLRDSQMGICASTRAMFDNMAATAGPIFEVNEDLLPPGRKSIGAIHAFKVIPREGENATANFPAVRPINTPSHIPAIQSIIAATRQQLDRESPVAPLLLGGGQQPLGEAFRTSQNMSMMTGGANLGPKDTARAFDRFTTGLVGGMLKWNMEFNENEQLKGDFSVRAKGNISLVAKEVQGAALDQLTATMTAEERAMVDTYGVLQDKFKSRDLPLTRLYPRDQAEQNVRSQQEAASAAAQGESALTQAKTQKLTAEAGKTAVETENMAQSAESIRAETLSKVEANLSKAKSAADKSGLENLKLLMESTDTKLGGQPR